jgi:hypothetical protein
MASSVVSDQLPDERELDEMAEQMAAIQEEEDEENDKVAASAAAASASSSSSPLEPSSTSSSLPATPAPTRHASIWEPHSSLSSSRIGDETLDQVAKSLESVSMNQKSAADESDEEDDDDDELSQGKSFDVTSALFQAASSMPSVFNLVVFGSQPRSISPTASVAASAAPSSSSSSSSRVARFAEAVSSITGGTAQERAEARALATAATWNPDGDDVTADNVGSNQDDDDDDDPFAVAARQKAAASNRKRYHHQ